MHVIDQEEGEGITIMPDEIVLFYLLENLASRILRNSSIKPIFVGAAIMHLQLQTYRFGPGYRKKS